MDLGLQVQQALQGNPGPLGPGFLTSFGLPANARLESADWIYRDFVRFPLTALSDINNQTKLFTKDLQGFARNLKFPLTSDLAFVHGNTLCYADFTFDPALTTESPLFGPMLSTVPFRFLSATKLTGQVSNKNYMDDILFPWTNYQLPSVIQPLTGQASSAPFAQFPPTYNQHHRVNKPESPLIVWPASSTVDLTLDTQVKTWWSQVESGVTETIDYTVPPWTTRIAVTLMFEFVGVQVRVVK
jgi:hypothetical protein